MLLRRPLASVSVVRVVCRLVRMCLVRAARSQVRSVVADSKQQERLMLLESLVLQVAHLVKLLRHLGARVWVASKLVSALAVRVVRRLVLQGSLNQPFPVRQVLQAPLVLLV